MTKKILATITTYNPEISLLEKNVDAVMPQVDKLIVYDNLSTNREQVITLCREKGVEVVLNDKNYGVAKPLYDGVEYADKNGYSYILTLDQDSVLFDKTVEKLTELMLSDDSIAIVATQPKLSAEGLDIDVPCVGNTVDMVITSGALADVAKIKAIGNYIPEMFIDRVDNEICYRAVENDFKVIQSNVPMVHRLGASQKRRFLFRNVHVQHYSPMRYYYIFRNGYYCQKRYAGEKKIKPKTDRLRYFFKVLLYEKKKFIKFKAMIKGLRDGKTFYADMRRKYANTEVMGENER